jgi:nitroreductase
LCPVFQQTILNQEKCLSGFLDVLTNRRAAERFDSTSSISDFDIRELIEEASQAPSSFNIQHCRFIEVTDTERRQRLKSATIESNLRRVADAPVTLLIPGDLNAHERLAGILDETVKARLWCRAVANVWVAMAV